MLMDDADELAASIEASLMGAPDAIPQTDAPNGLAAKLGAVERENQKYGSHFS